MAAVRSAVPSLKLAGTFNGPPRGASRRRKRYSPRIQSMGGGGSIAGGGAGGSIGNPNTGAGAAMAGGGITMQIKIDEAALKSQIDGFFRSYQVPPIKIPVELVASGQVGGAANPNLGAVASMPTAGRVSSAAEVHGVNTYGVIGEANGVADLTRSAAFAGQNPGRPGTMYTPPEFEISRRGGRVGTTFAMAGGRFMQGLEEAGEGEEESSASQWARYRQYRDRDAIEQANPGGGRGSLSRLNLFSPRGLARGLGISLTGVIAADYALRTIGGLEEAENIESHPEYISQRYALSGSGNTRQMLGANASRASHNSKVKMRDTRLSKVSR